MKKTIKIISAYKKNSRALLNFLIKNHEFKFSEINMYKLLQSFWNPKSKIGYIMKINKKIIGFYGIIKSKNNLLCNSKIQICNVHTWVVNKKYRQYCHLLVKKISKIPKIIVSHTAKPVLNKILFRYGFEILDRGYFIIICIPFLVGAIKKKLEYKKNLISKNKIQYQHFNNHKEFSYELINFGKEKCIIIFEIKKKLLFFKYIVIYSLYNKKYFNTNIKLIKNILIKEYGCLFIKIDSRFINKKNNSRMLYKPYKNMNKLYKLPVNFKKINFKKEKLSNLYSEIQFL